MAQAFSPWQLTEAVATLMRERDRLLREDPMLCEDEQELIAALQAADETADALAVLHRMVDAALIADARANAAGDLLDRLKARRERYAARCEALRATVLAVMQALELRRLDAPNFTVSRRRGQARVIVTDESALPEEFIRVTVSREPNRAALKEALQVDGEIVEGATLANASDVLTIRTN